MDVSINSSILFNIHMRQGKKESRNRNFEYNQIKQRANKGISWIEQKAS